jgi:hypothetical protein
LTASGARFASFESDCSCVSLLRTSAAPSGFGGTAAQADIKMAATADAISVMPEPTFEHPRGIAESRQDGVNPRIQ